MPSIQIAELIGSRLVDVCRLEAGRWVFKFDNGIVIGSDSLWRVVLAGQIKLTSQDDGQRFGLPNPIDAEAACRELLLSHAVSAADIRADTRDICLQFGDERRFEILPTSSGFENWELCDKQGRLTVAQGGGELAEWF